MPKENIVYNTDNYDDEMLDISFKKIWKTILSRKSLVIKVFCSVLCFFILLTFILPKKYTVTANLYINKSNNSNMMEYNPFMFDDNSSGLMASMGADKAINNEVELMTSALVLDKVIRENKIVYKKKYGIIPNKKEGEFLSAKAFYNNGKILKIENIKNSNVITIEYKSKNQKLAYGVVSSLIKNYINLHKEINIEKSIADKKILEAEYIKAKENLDRRLRQSRGLPSQVISGVGNLSALSAFSKVASGAMGNIQGQYVANERSQIAINEEKQKVAQLAAKLEWANMVNQMASSSKVLVLEEPKKLRDFENSSPNLLINIILGIIFGGLSSIIALVYSEVSDKKLSYSMLTNDIIYDGEKNIEQIKLKIFSYNPCKVLIISLTKFSEEFAKELKELTNTTIIIPEISDTFIKKIAASDKVVLCSKVFETDAEQYKIVKDILKNQKKDIIFDIVL